MPRMGSSVLLKHPVPFGICLRLPILDDWYIDIPFKHTLEPGQRVIAQFDGDSVAKCLPQLPGPNQATPYDWTKDCIKLKCFVRNAAPPPAARPDDKPSVVTENSNKRETRSIFDQPLHAIPKRKRKLIMLKDDLRDGLIDEDTYRALVDEQYEK